ncbi:MAG: hypothetical protein ABIP85_12290 [Chthoniobacteraceae bacterium]
MKNLLHERNSTRPLGGSGILREHPGSVLPGSAITSGAGGRFHPRPQAAKVRCEATRIC